MSEKHEKQAKSLPIILLLIVVVFIVGIALGFFLSRQDFNSSTDSDLSSVQNDSSEEVDQIADSSQSDSDQENSDADYITISTELGDLYYPEQWADYLETSQEWEDDSLIVSFSAKIDESEFPMFQVTIGSSEDTLVGELTDDSGTKRNVYMSVEEIETSDALSEEEQQRLYAMQEDLNYVIDHLA